MHKSKFWPRGMWVDIHFSQWVTMIMIMIHIGLGVAVVSGGVERFSIPSYSPLIHYSGGETWIWGAWICTSGILMSSPFRWPNMVGLWMGLFWHIIWMTCFTVATLRYETAASTPIPVYGGLGMICAALLTARAIDKTKG